MRRPLLLDSIRGVAAACSVFGLTSIAMPGAQAAAAAAADSSETCLACHADKDAKGAGGKSIAVDGSAFAKSVHGELKLDCTACHTDVSAKHLPHAEKLKPVACGSCHDKEVKEYGGTAHGVAVKGGSTVAATCADCHGTHDIRRSKDPASRTSHAGLEATCGKCHGNEAMVRQAKLPGGNVGAQFHDSIHGRALDGAARGSAPTCTNCHGAHSIHPKSDPQSSTHRARIPDTCGACHTNERQQFAKGQHGKLRQEGNLGAPGCTDCHGAHRIQAHDLPLFQTEVIKECGNCHVDYLKTYRDTFHGQVTALGYSRMATCASCHGAHEILPASNPASMVSPQNRLKTCQTCHAGASQNFANYDPHANRHDRARSPLYYYAGKFMEWLLIGVFAFFAVHTLLWLYRSVRERFERRTPPGAGGGGTLMRYYRRFSRSERIMHAFLMLAFVGCALTGLPPLFAEQPWASTLARLLGGFEGAGLIHRVCAFVMVVLFVGHVAHVALRALTSGKPLGVLWGPDSMVPQPQDAIDMFRHFKWFLARGPRPVFGRWTYWEKFDYWAVFWGMFIIGGSGLLLWFPVFFAKLLPGWMFNIAALVHGEEALLAVGFIFTIHFFNSHLRPEKFPMDTVIFTGRISEEELKHERAVEFERLQREGRLAAMEAPPPTLESRTFGWFVGGAALLLGIAAIVLIVYSVVS